MEQRFMGIVTTVILIVTIVVCFLLMYIPGIHIASIEFRDRQVEKVGAESIFGLLQESEEAIEEKPEIAIDVLKGHQIRLKLPQNVTSAGISVESNYINRQTCINIKGIGKDYFNDSPITGNADHIVDITYESENMVGKINFVLDDVLEVIMVSEDEYVYFDFVEPHEIYDYVVVVDAGHGGSAPGATKQGVYEKDIDLAFVLELQKLFEQSDKNIKVYYTRTTDVNPSFDARVGLANDTDADVFLSIHNNSTASGRMSSISGTEVMYKGSDKSGESKLFASICLNHLLGDLESKSKGTVVGDEIYIIRESKSPVALVEVGFMTNKDDLEKLQDSDYQKKAAKAMYDAVIEFLYE